VWNSKRNNEIKQKKTMRKDGKIIETNEKERNTQKKK
jgi:hypothetical protein